VLSGWVTKATLRNAMIALTVIDGLIMLLLAYWHGPLVIAFVLAGLFLSVFYVAPPFRLKQHGLGELDVFLTWGPLMIGGVYLVATDSVPLWVLVFSMPYALLVTSVLFGKHIDKIEHDPVLPIARSRRARGLGRAVGPAGSVRYPNADQRPACLQLAQAGRTATVVSGPRLAAVVRRLCLPPRAPGRCAINGWPADQRPRPDQAAPALAVASPSRTVPSS
jgi:UbiA prenyltransferase family